MWSIKHNDFCAVNETFMEKLCDQRGHYGHVFVVLPLPRGRPGAIVGLKLITTCQCKTVTDGVYQGQLWLPKPWPNRCLFVNMSKLSPIQFENSQFGGFQVDDVAQIFVPSIERFYFGVVKNIDESGDVEAQVFDHSCQLLDSFDEVNPKLQKNYADSTNVLVTLRPSFVKTVFRYSRVRTGDICKLFVPGQAKVECLLEERRGSKIQVKILKGNINMAKLHVDEKFYRKNGEERFCVDEIFLEFVKPMADNAEVLTGRSQSFRLQDDVYACSSSSSEDFLLHGNSPTPQDKRNRQAKISRGRDSQHQFYQVTVLEGNVAYSQVNVDQQLFRKTGEGQFCVSEAYLEFLQNTSVPRNRREEEGIREGDICRLIVPGQGKFQCLVERQINHHIGMHGIGKVISPDYYIENVDENQYYVSESLLTILSATGRGNRAESTGTARLSEGDICELGIPGQGKFQCLVEGRRSDDIIIVSLLDGVIDMFKIGNENQNERKDLSKRGFNGNENWVQRDFAYDDLNNWKFTSFVNIGKHTGRYKGIQGHANSCYMDTLLYSLFSFNDSLDALFQMNNDDEPRHLELKSLFQQLIVNPLRNDKCFVTSQNMMQLRNKLEPFLAGVSREEKDVVEVLSVLFSNNFAGKNGYPPLVKLNSSILGERQNLFVYEIMIETQNHQDALRKEKLVPHIADLLGESLLQQGQTLEENPPTFMIQLPRFGKEKLFPGVFLPGELDISEISPYSTPNCCLCQHVAVVRCRECSLGKLRSQFVQRNARGLIAMMTFCQACFGLQHQAKQDHFAENLQPPAEFLLAGKSSSLYSLEAVICIEQSHYVSFVRAKKDRCDDEFCWLFFDSMAERQVDYGFDEEFEHNVPAVRDATKVEIHMNKLGSLSSEQRYEYLLQQAFSNENVLLKRLIQDAYLCIYKQK